jgi:hypothetical protein
MDAVAVVESLHVPERDEAADRRLRLAATLFAVVVLLHNGDHLRRGADAVSDDVFWVGSSAMVIEVGVVALVFVRHRLAALAAVAAGFGLAAGYLLVHFTPGRSWLSDSFPSGDVSAVSWAAGLAEVAAALVLGWAGWRAAFGSSPALAPVDAAPAPTWRDALREPVVVAFAAGNVVIFVAALAGA